MTKSLKQTLEALTRAYWIASTTLSGRGIRISSKTAIGHLLELSQDPDFARLRCAAAGRIASLGLSDLVRAPEGAANADPGSFVLGRMSGGGTGHLAVRDDAPTEETHGIRQPPGPQVLLLPPPASLVLEGAS